MALLDTHVLIWLASDPGKLSVSLMRALEQNRAQLQVSVVTSWEIALLVRRGRLALPLPAADFLERALAWHGIEELPLQRAAILRAVGLPELHADPFDRILIAEAQLRGVPLLSQDRVVARYPGVKVIG